MQDMVQLLAQLDVIDKIRPLLNKKELIIDFDGRIRMPLPAMQYLSADKIRPFPWVYHFNGKQTGRHCSYWIEIVWKAFGVLPAFCRHRCYKVVCRPRNFREMMEWHEKMKTCGMPGKLGPEHRPQVPHPWGSYFYCNGEKQAKEYFAKVKDMAFDGMSVIYKRACTEMELAYGPPHTWPEPTPFERMREKLVGRA